MFLFLCYLLVHYKYIYMDGFNYVRYPQSFDYSKVKVINNKQTLSLPPSLHINNEIDELRVRDFMKNEPEPRKILDLDEIERMRLARFGQKVDISPEKLYEKFAGTALKLPVLNDVGVPVVGHDGRIIYQMIAFRDLIQDEKLLTYRLKELMSQMGIGDASPARQVELRLIAHALKTLKGVGTRTPPASHTASPIPQRTLPGATPTTPTKGSTPTPTPKASTPETKVSGDLFLPNDDNENLKSMDLELGNAIGATSKHYIQSFENAVASNSTRMDSNRIMSDMRRVENMDVYAHLVNHHSGFAPVITIMSFIYYLNTTGVYAGTKTKKYNVIQEVKNFATHGGPKNFRIDWDNFVALIDKTHPFIKMHKWKKK